MSFQKKNQPIVPSPKIKFLPTPKQHQAWLRLTDKITNEITYGGGAGGGKTTLGAAWLIINALRYPGSRWIVGRKELKRLKQSVLLTIFDLFSLWKFRNKHHYVYNQQDSTIKFWNGSEFHLMDLDYLPSDPNYERLGSIEYTGGFLEEASEIEQKAKEVVKSRIRYKLNEFNLIPKLLLTCNPHKGYIYQEFYKPWRKHELAENKAFIRSLVTDNPHISPHYIQSLKDMKDRVLRERLLYGNWEYDDDDNALFSYDALTDLFTNTIDETEDKYIVCDVARFGRDKAVIILWKGLQAKEIRYYPKSATTDLESTIITMAALHHVPMSRVLVDEDGVGGGVVDHLRCKGFVGNSSPIESKKPSEIRATEYKINFQNLRTQCYYVLSEKVNERLISISCDDVEVKDNIVEELEQIRARDVDKDTKFRIVSKEDIKPVLGRSPDFADTLMMRMYFEVKPELKKSRALAEKPF